MPASRLPIQALRERARFGVAEPPCAVVRHNANKTCMLWYAITNYAIRLLPCRELAKMYLGCVPRVFCKKAMIMMCIMH